MHEQLTAFINSKVPGARAELLKRECGDQVIYVDRNSILLVCQTLKLDPNYDFNVLQVITGTDYEDRLEISYILASFTKNTELILKVKMPKVDSLEIDSVCSVWSAANWQERECYDMLGVKFRNHPDLRRILCGDDWEGFPLRKDYRPAESYNGMVINPVSKMNIPDREFAEKQKKDNQVQ